jgi:two-component system, sensor histidine kinase LadS
MAQIASTPTIAKFKVQSDETMYVLEPHQRLWARIELDRPAASARNWKLWVPLPLIDAVSVYELQDAASNHGWLERTAGDKVAVSKWPEAGRYPRFNMDVPVGKSVVYLRIQSSTPVSLPLWLADQSQAQEFDQLGNLGLGVVLGALMLLILLCFVQGVHYRDMLYGVYGAYGLVLILAVGSYTGLAAQLLWTDSPIWADTAQGCLALFAVGFALFFIDAVLVIPRYAAQRSQVIRSFGVLGLVFAVTYYFAPRSVGIFLLATYVPASALLGLWSARVAWQRGDVVGQWVFWAYMPLALFVLLAIARVLGWMPVSWLVQYGVVVALVIEVPLLMVALHLRSHERHAALAREESLSTRDALTGLLARPIFEDRLQQAVARSRKHGEEAAVVLVSLVNYSHIAEALDATLAEQSLIHCVAKIRRVLDDGNTAARTAAAQFGLIIEGAKTRDEVIGMAVRLIASGLMPIKSIKPEVTLQFQFAAVLLREFTDDVTQLQPRLQELLTTISPRSRRPIRFLDPTPTDATPLAQRETPANVPDTSQDPVEPKRARPKFGSQSSLGNGLDSESDRVPLTKA